MITLRQDKTEPLTRDELDNNFIEITKKVSLLDTENIGGIKTFTQSPIVPNLTVGDTTSKAANAKFVNDTKNDIMAAVALIPTSDNTKLPLVGGTITGDLAITGNLTVAGNITETSDERLKTDIKPITNALEKVLALNGVSYIKEDELNIGLIAQQVKDIVPEVVRRQDLYYSVAYGNIVALLIEAIKEQDKRIKELEAK